MGNKKSRLVCTCGWTNSTSHQLGWMTPFKWDQPPTDWVVVLSQSPLKCVEIFCSKGSTSKVVGHTSPLSQLHPDIVLSPRSLSAELARDVARGPQLGCKYMFICGKWEPTNYDVNPIPKRSFAMEHLLCRYAAKAAPTHGLPGPMLGEQRHSLGEGF